MGLASGRGARPRRPRRTSDARAPPPRFEELRLQPALEQALRVARGEPPEVHRRGEDELLFRELVASLPLEKGRDGLSKFFDGRSPERLGRRPGRIRMADNRRNVYPQDRLLEVGPREGRADPGPAG